MSNKSKKEASRHKARVEKASKNNDLFRDKADYPRKKLRVSLPIAPSVNHYMFITRRGKRVLTKDAKKYIREATALINQAVDDQNWMKQREAVWYYMDICVYMPDRRIRDSHNMLKVLIDVFQGTVIHNDYYLMPRIQGVEYDAKNPRMNIVIRPQTVSNRKHALEMCKV